MSGVFVYGTLRHIPLLKEIAGKGFDALRIAPARLPDHAVYWVEGESFPILVEERGCVAEGLLVENLDDEVLARLDFYEGGFGYRLLEREVQTEGGAVAARVYFCAPGAWPPGAPWDLEVWAERYGPLSLYAAQEVMRRRGTQDAEAVARGFGMIRTRAQARLTARAQAQGDDGRRVEVLRDEILHAGHYLMKRYCLRHETFAGGLSEPVEREILVSGDAALVLPYDPARDRVLLVEQLRMGPLGRGDPIRWALEPIAGMIDGGESPEEAAGRELEEEAGISAGTLELIARFYPSPGGSTDYFHLYLALCDLPDGAGETGGGLDSENEDIRTHLMSFDDALRTLGDGRARNGPLITGLLWLERERARLRASA